MDRIISPSECQNSSDLEKVLRSPLCLGKVMKTFKHIVPESKIIPWINYMSEREMKPQVSEYVLNQFYAIIKGL